MKRQNREVNIFNMSLLDILCGALGAFCFMMLSLFPYQAKAKQLQAKLDRMQQGSGVDAEARAQQAEREAQEAKERAEQAEEEARKARSEQSLAFFMISWEGPEDIDLWLKAPDGRWVLPKPDQLPKDKVFGQLGDVTKGPAKEQAWLKDVAYPGDKFTLYAKLQSGTATPGRIQVMGYITARIRLNATTNKMTLTEFPGEFLHEGETLELGSVTFTQNDFQLAFGPTAAERRQRQQPPQQQQPPAQGPPPQGPPPQQQPPPQAAPPQQPRPPQQQPFPPQQQQQPRQPPPQSPPKPGPR